MADTHAGRVLLLGGTSEIGLATVRQLRPTSVVLVGRDAERLATAALALHQDLPGIHIEQRSFDATDLEGLKTLVANAFEAGTVDVLLPAFGVLGNQTQAEEDPLHAAEVLQVNLVAQAVALLEAAKGFRAQGHGTLVVFSSIAAVRARRANFVYGASKAGIDALGFGLSMALADTAVRVLVVRPGFVIGSMTAGMKPAPLATTPEKVAIAIEEALRSGRRTVWVPRKVVFLAWVLRVLPLPALRRLPR